MTGNKEEEVRCFLDYQILILIIKEEEIIEIETYKPGAPRPFSAKKQQKAVEKYKEKQYNI